MIISTPKTKAVNICGGSTLVDGGSDLIMVGTLYSLYYYYTWLIE